MTQQEALAIIETEVAKHTELSEIDSTSKVSIWYYIKYVFSAVASLISEIWLAYQAEVNAAIAAAPYGTVQWYILRAKEFQVDELLTVIEGKPQYTTDVPEAKIIQQVAVVPLNRVLIFKIAKSDGATGLQACSSEEVTKFLAYINHIKYPGTQVTVQSYNADKLILNWKIYYNALTDLTVLRTAVETAVNSYLSGIVFNGKFSVTECTDQLQKVTAVINPVFISASGRQNAQAIAEAVSFTEYYESIAGYMQVDTFNFTYIPA